MEFLKPTTFKHTTVLLRVDINVPLDEETGNVADDFRIRQLLPTIHTLQKGGNKIIILAHLGRPEGKWDKKFTLLPVAKHVASVLDLPFYHASKAWPKEQRAKVVFFDGNILEEKNQEMVQFAPSADLIILENIRFYKGEDENDPVLAKKLGDLADAYVNDAFSVDHRAAASISGITERLPSFGGPLLEQEIKSLTHILQKGKHPFVVLMGGIKISDKARTLENLGKRADHILLGGGLANLIFKSKGLEIGLSKIEAEAEKIAWGLEKNYKHKLVLPVDVVVAHQDMHKDSIRVCTPYDIRKDELVLDCGPKTILEFSKYLKTAETIVWNGPLGHFEVKPFHTATMALARLIGGRGKGHAYAVVGGGETVDAVRQCHQAEHVDHLSTGGGAMLEFLAGKPLPGIEALK